MNDGCRNRRYARAIALAEKTERNTLMIAKTVWQDERDFTLDVQNDRVYGKGKQSDVPDENLFASTNKMSRKVMVSTAISQYSATKPFFVNENGIKVIKIIIVNNVKRDDWIFFHNSALSHQSNLVQDFIEKNFETPFR